MTLYFVESKINAVDLYELKDGRFQTCRKGNLSPFMNGNEYILVDERLANFLSSLNISEIKFSDAVIWKREDNTEHKNYKKLTIEKRITDDILDSQDTSGLQIYLYNSEYLFVSDELKELLEREDFDYLSFSQGLSRFAS